MSIFIEKLGLYEDFVFDKDVPAGRYKTYEYTEKEASELKQKTLIPCLRVDTNKNIRIKNGWLYIDESEYLLNGLYLEDIIFILKEHECTPYLLYGFEKFRYLPAYLLGNMDNVTIVQFKGDHSPFNLGIRMQDFGEFNNTILSMSSAIQSLSIFDLESQKEIENTVDDNDYLYFKPTNKSTIILNLFSSSFYLYLDMNSKILVNTPNIGNIIKNEYKP